MFVTTIYYGISFPLEKVPEIFQLECENATIKKYDYGIRFNVRENINLITSPTIQCVKTDFTCIIGICVSQCRVYTDNSFMTIPDVSESIKKDFTRFIKANPVFASFKVQLCCHNVNSDFYKH